VQDAALEQVRVGRNLGQMPYGRRRHPGRSRFEPVAL
jgi:hypothetical protein